MSTFVITPDENGFNEEKFKQSDCYKCIMYTLDFAALKQNPAVITIDVASECI